MSNTTINTQSKKKKNLNELSKKELKLLKERADYITGQLELYCEEIDPMDFYRFMFPVGSFETKGEFVEGRYNGILREVTNEFYIDSKNRKKRKVNRYTITDDLDILKEVIESNTDEFVITQTVSYIGKSAEAKHAREIYALAIDLDGIKIQSFGDDIDGLGNLFYSIDKTRALPDPTFIVMSGTGLHLYFILEKPIKLYYKAVKELQKLKDKLTEEFWYGSITLLDDKVQYEPIMQPFRVIGTHTKLGTKVRAFIKSGERVSIDYLNSFVPSDYQADLEDLQVKTSMSLKEAKERYPNWKPGKKKGWQFHRAVYDSWIKRIKENSKIKFGNRYWSIFVMATLAIRCDITYEELEEDAYGLIPTLNAKDKYNPFTEEDVLSALRGYSESYRTLGLTFVNYKFDNICPPAKRNGKKQAYHLEDIREKKAKMKIRDEEFKNPEGRPKGSGTKKEAVAEWRKLNPEGTKADCIRETGISKMTVYKWWDGDESAAKYEKTPKLIFPDPKDITHPNPNWHTEMPQHYVVSGRKDSMDKLATYAAKGIRSVEILSEEEFTYLSRKK